LKSDIEIINKKNSTDHRISTAPQKSFIYYNCPKFIYLLQFKEINRSLKKSYFKKTIIELSVYQ